MKLLQNNCKTFINNEIIAKQCHLINNEIIAKQCHLINNEIAKHCKTMPFDLINEMKLLQNNAI